jgi:hypothetical protein
MLSTLYGIHTFVMRHYLRILAIYHHSKTLMSWIAASLEGRRQLPHQPQKVAQWAWVPMAVGEATQAPAEILDSEM